LHDIIIIMSAYRDIKVTTYNPKTGETHTKYAGYKSETYLPKTQSTIKLKDKSTRPDLADSEFRELP
jgi:hypothetical protein